MTKGTGILFEKKKGIKLILISNIKIKKACLRMNDLLCWKGARMVQLKWEEENVWQLLMTNKGENSQTGLCCPTMPMTKINR